MTEGLEEQGSIFPNPGNPLEVRLSVFEGPLDLLLHLIRKNQFDIKFVRLSQLTQSYLSYLDWMQSIDLDIAGEFMEIASTLILIKSRELLPKPKNANPEEGDPEEQLRSRLIEYQRYKEASIKLMSLDVLGRDVYLHPMPEKRERDPDEILEFEEVSLFALMDAFRAVLERRPRVVNHVVASEKYRIEDRIADIIQRLSQQPECPFEQLFDLMTGRSRPYFVITFMAILEMVKLKIVKLNQDKLFGTILCIAAEDFNKNANEWYHIQKYGMVKDNQFTAKRAPQKREPSAVDQEA